MVHGAGDDLLGIVRELQFIHRRDAGIVHGLPTVVSPAVVFGVEFVEVRIRETVGQRRIRIAIDRTGRAADAFGIPLLDVEVGEARLNVEDFGHLLVDVETEREFLAVLDRVRSEEVEFARHDALVAEHDARAGGPPAGGRVVRDAERRNIGSPARGGGECRRRAGARRGRKLIGQHVAAHDPHLLPVLDVGVDDGVSEGAPVGRQVVTLHVPAREVLLPALRRINKRRPQSQILAQAPIHVEFPAVQLVRTKNEIEFLKVPVPRLLRELVGEPARRAFAVEERLRTAQQFHALDVVAVGGAAVPRHPVAQAQVGGDASEDETLVRIFRVRIDLARDAEVHRVGQLGGDQVVEKLAVQYRDGIRRVTQLGERARAGDGLRGAVAFVLVGIDLENRKHHRVRRAGRRAIGLGRMKGNKAEPKGSGQQTGKRAGGLVGHGRMN